MPKIMANVAVVAVVKAKNEAAMENDIIIAATIVCGVA